jgi:hypothetical protein
MKTKLYAYLDSVYENSTEYSDTEASGMSATDSEAADSMNDASVANQEDFKKWYEGLSDTEKAGVTAMCDEWAQSKSDITYDEAKEIVSTHDMSDESESAYDKAMEYEDDEYASNNPDDYTPDGNADSAWNALTSTVSREITDNRFDFIHDMGVDDAYLEACSSSVTTASYTESLMTSYDNVAALSEMSEEEILAYLNGDLVMGDKIVPSLDSSSIVKTSSWQSSSLETHRSIEGSEDLGAENKLECTLELPTIDYGGSESDRDEYGM